jgi:hypothetical protein
MSHARRELLFIFALFGVAGWVLALLAFRFFGESLPVIGLPARAVAAVQCSVLLGYGALSALVLWRNAPDPKGTALHAVIRTYAAIALILCVLLVTTAVLWFTYANP